MVLPVIVTHLASGPAHAAVSFDMPVPCSGCDKTGLNLSAGLNPSESAPSADPCCPEQKGAPACMAQCAAFASTAILPAGTHALAAIAAAVYFHINSAFISQTPLIDPGPPRRG